MARMALLGLSVMAVTLGGCKTGSGGSDVASWQNDARSTQAHTDSAGHVLWQEIQCIDGRHQSTMASADGSVSVFEDHGTPQKVEWVKVATVSEAQVNDAVCANGQPPSGQANYQCHCSASSLACSIIVNGVEEPLPNMIDLGSATECSDMLALSKRQNRFCIGRDLYFMDALQHRIKRLQTLDNHGYCLLTADNQDLGSLTPQTMDWPDLACTNSQYFSDGTHAWPAGGGCQYFSDGTHCWFPDGGCQYFSDGTHCFLPHGECKYTSSGTICTFDGRQFASVGSYKCHN